MGRMSLCSVYYHYTMSSLFVSEPCGAWWAEWARQFGPYASTSDSFLLLRRIRAFYQTIPTYIRPSAWTTDDREGKRAGGCRTRRVRSNTAQSSPLHLPSSVSPSSLRYASLYASDNTSWPQAIALGLGHLGDGIRLGVWNCASVSLIA